MRAPWSDYFMALAELVASRATCPRRHVGAVLVLDNRVIGTGYNGSPPGQPHCDEVGCLMDGQHCVRTVHAELNALLHASRPPAGATLYLTDRPCLRCTNVLIAAKIEAVRYRDEYPASRDDVNHALATAGIPIHRHAPSGAGRRAREA